MENKKDEEKLKLYQNLVDTWSALYKSKIGDLLSLEEIKQQAWVGVLEASSPKEADNTEAYLGRCIKHKIVDLIMQELKITKGTANIWQPYWNTTNGEKVSSSKESLEKLKQKIEGIPHAPFVFKYIGTHTVREISEIAKKEGRKLGKSQVSKVISKIKEELSKIIEGET